MATTRTIEDHPQLYARTAGVLYLAIILCGKYAEGFVSSRLLGADAAETAHNILASPGLWQLGVAANLLVALLATALLWFEWQLLRPVDRRLTLLAIVFNLVSIGVESLSKVCLMLVLPALRGTGSAGAFDAAQGGALAQLMLRAHDASFNVALIFFGVTCIVYGVLIRRSGYLPKAVGWLMQAAGAAYLIGCTAALFLPAVANAILPGILIVPLIGESSFCLWLLVKGVDVGVWRARMAAAGGPR